MSSIFDKLTDADSMKFIDQIGDAFKSLPHLPTGVIDFIVMLSPWFTLLGAILGLIALPFLGIASAFTLLALSPVHSIIIFVMTVALLLQVVLMFMAFNPLKNMETKGWVFLFWGEVIYAIEAILRVLSGQYGVIEILGIIITFYILFEVRSRYGMAGKVVQKIKEVTAGK